MHAESQYSDIPFSDKQLFVTAENSKDHFFKVSEVDGLVVGYMAGTVFPLNFSDYLVAYDHAMYVSPKFRNGGGGADLIRSFIKWSKEQGANEIRVGISYEFDSSKHEYIKRLMTALKFKAKGEWFKRKLWQE
jgi:L-amino acid N-acyltransferase YncA